MLISVIIPVYNSSSTIVRCVESVVISLDKVTNDYEIICVDDGSSDDSLHLLNEIALQNHRIIVIHQENAGAAVARNTGLNMAKGDYIAFNDSDDEWLENHFEVLLYYLKKFPEVDCISANHDKEKLSTFLLTKYNESLYKVTLNSQQFKSRFSPPNSMMKREIIDGGIRFDSKLKGSEEFFFYNCILYKYNCFFLNKKTAQSILHKKRYGECGLSGNLKEMEKGELYSIRYARKKLGLSFVVYCMAMCFSVLKYFRRIVIVKLRKKRI
ncbi:MAG: glycosyltransferase family 2 protein [Bacteroidaceae bacterium]|nr:glycosyltransferase family 2 protein [Bacteroidaceae bacterium]